MKGNFLIFLFLCAIIACNNKTPEKLSHGGADINIDIPELTDDIGKTNLSEAYSANEYIKLETNPNCLLNNWFERIIIYDNKLYLFDNKIVYGINRGSPTQQSISVFDKEGKFLYKIGAYGKGPGEYTHIRNFEIVQDKVIISTYDKVLFYSLQGQFIKALKKPEFIFNVVRAIDQNNFFFQLSSVKNKSDYKRLKIKEMPYEIIKCDSNLNIIKGVKAFSFSPGVITGSPLVNYGSLMYYTKYFNDTIFVFDKDGNSKENFILKFKEKNKIPQKLLVENRGIALARFPGEKNYAVIQDLFVLKDYYVVCVKAKNAYKIIISKKTYKMKIINMSKSINDIDEFSFDITSAIPNNNKIIVYNLASEILKKVKKKDCKTTGIAKKLKEDDNAVIAVYEIKDF